MFCNFFLCFINFQWASCHIKIDTDLVHSTLNHMVSLLHSSTPKGPQLSSTSALLSQVTCLLPTSSNDQSDTVSTKVKMWSEINRRKTFMNWPHKDYKWAVPDTMAQAGFFHQVAVLNCIYFISALRFRQANNKFYTFCI